MNNTLEERSMAFMNCPWKSTPNAIISVKRAYTAIQMDLRQFLMILTD